MPSTAGETFYDLAIRALAEQESQVSGLRARTGTLVAGAAVVATLLAKPVFAAAHPDGLVEWCAAAVGLGGLAVVVGAAVYLLRSHDLAFALDVRETYSEAEARGDLDDDQDVGALHAQLAFTMADRHAANAGTVLDMRDAFRACAGRSRRGGRWNGSCRCVSLRSWPGARTDSPARRT